MAFDSLSEKLGNIFKNLRSKGKLTEDDVKKVMREIKLALLAADVNYMVVKDFIAAVSEKATGTEVLEKRQSEVCVKRSDGRYALRSSRRGQNHALRKTCALLQKSRQTSPARCLRHLQTRGNIAVAGSR